MTSSPHNNTPGQIHVVKLGGSLLDLPDLPLRLRNYRAASPHLKTLLVVGGGDAADTVRRFDRLHQLGPERGHWLAIRAMQFNAHLLASILPGCQLVKNHQLAQEAWHHGSWAVADPLLWLRAEEEYGITVPHRWSFTSDSIAAHLARRLNAHKLTLLKSTLPPNAAAPSENTCSHLITPLQAAAQGVVDEDFPQTSAGIPLVELVNLRQDPPPRCVLTYV